MWKDGQFSMTPQAAAPEILEQFGKAVDALRQDAKEKGLDKLSKREINRMVADVRREMKEERKRKAW